LFLFLRLVWYCSQLEELVLGCFVKLECELCLEAVASAGLGRSQDGPRNVGGTVLMMVEGRLGTVLRAG